MKAGNFRKTCVLASGRCISLKCFTYRRHCLTLFAQNFWKFCSKAAREVNNFFCKAEN